MWPVGRRPFDALTSLLNGIGTVWIIGLMVLINADIAGRALLGKPISGVVEMVSLSIVGIVFLQLAHTLRVGRITRSDALLRVLARHFPRVQQGLEAVFNLVGAGVLGVLFWSSYPLLVKAWVNQTFVGAVGDFTAPVWPIKLIILIGAGAMGLQFLINAVVAARQAFTGTRGPDV